MIERIRARRIQRGREALAATLEAEGVEPMTASDLRVIQLALETHERVHIERAGNPDAPAAIAARKVRAKIDRNTIR